MFDTVVTRCVKPKSVEWKQPDRMILELEDSEQPEIYELLKGAMDYLHHQMDVKCSTSKELYKKQPQIWERFKDLQLAKCQDNPDERLAFSLEKDSVVYLVNDTHQIVDIIDLGDKEKMEEFLNLHKKFILDLTTIERSKKFFTDGSGGVTKFVCYAKDVDVTAEDYVPVVIMELNSIKSSFIVHRGIFMYSTFTIFPELSCDYDERKLSDFIRVFDLDSMLIRANEGAERLYTSYQSLESSPVEISVRELTSILKKVGYKLELDTSDAISPIQNISDEENKQKICDFYNTFQFKTGESALQILQLSELKKAFRYNKLTLLEMLKILSKEYLTYEGSKISVDTLCDIIFKLHDFKGTDKVQTVSIEKESK